MTIVYKDSSQIVPGRTGDPSRLQYILGFNSNYEARYLDVNSLIYSKVPRDLNSVEVNRDIYALGGFVYSLVHSNEYQSAIQGSRGLTGIQGEQGPQGSTGNKWDYQRNKGVNYLRSLFSYHVGFNTSIGVILRLLTGNVDPAELNQWNLQDTEIQFTDTSKSYSKVNKFIANNQ